MGCAPAAMWAAPVTYNFEGVLSLGTVGADAQALASHLSPAAFGAYTASITYDGDTLQFNRNIYANLGADPELVGSIYDVAGTATVTLANGTTLTNSGLTETVYNDLMPGGSSFGVNVGFSIPDSLWLGAPPRDCSATQSAACWLPQLSYLNLRTGGAWPASAAAPRSLDSVTQADLEGLIRGDANHDGVVNLSRETINLTGGGPRVMLVAEPPVLALFGLALALLAWGRRVRTPMRGSPVTTVPG
jgi:hypothetical protein